MKRNRLKILLIISLLLGSCEFEKPSIVSKSEVMEDLGGDIVMSLSYDMERLSITSPKNKSNMDNIAFTEQIELTPVVRREAVNIKFYKDGSMDAEIKELKPLKFKVPRDDYYEKPTYRTRRMSRGGKIETIDEKGNIVSEGNMKDPKLYKDMVKLLSKGAKELMNNYDIYPDESEDYSKKSKSTNNNISHKSKKGVAFVKSLGGSVLKYKVINNDSPDEENIFIVDTLRDLKISHKRYKLGKIEYKEDYIYDDIRKSNPKLKVLQREYIYKSEISGVEMRRLEIEKYDKYQKRVKKN